MKTLATLSKCWNIFILNCKDAREIRTSFSSGDRQATNSLSPSNREAVPSAQQSQHAPAHWYRGARSSSGITVMSKPQDGWRGAACSGELVHIQILQGLVPQDTTLAVAVGLQGTIGNGGVRGGTGLWVLALYLPHFCHHSCSKGKGRERVSLLFLFKGETKGEAGWKENLEQEDERERFEFCKSKSLLALEPHKWPSVTKKALGLWPKHCCQKEERRDLQKWNGIVSV